MSRHIRIFVLVFITVLLPMTGSFAATDAALSRAELYKKYYSYYRHREFDWAVGPYITFIPGLAIGGSFKYNLTYPWSLNINASFSGAGNNKMGFYIGPNIDYNFYIYGTPQFVPYIGGGAGIYNGNGSNVIGVQVNGGAEFFLERNISLYADLGLAVNLASNLNFGAKWYFK